MGVYEEFIYTRTYSKWIPELNRRESWNETVNRFCDYIFNETLNCDKIPAKTKDKIKNYILAREIMPSMRLMFSAGENCRRDNIAAYNCSALCMDSIEAFGENMYLLLAGAGVGFSVEHRYIDQLPVVNKQRNLPPLKFTVPDTRLGWKQTVDFAVENLFAGRDVSFDFSQIRPAGTPLVISGGYASGPEPLQRCLEFIRETIIGSQGRRLTSLEIFDICCEIASSVVCGGVRRSSESCLCDMDDKLMKNAKLGDFHPRRYMANISVVYRNKPSVLDFTQEFLDSFKSGSGEPGIFNLVAARKITPKRRDSKKVIISNPCFETLLRNMGLCNLTEIIIRNHDDFDTVVDKIKTCTWLGVIQSTLTYFPNLRPEWTKNAEEERLLGVSLTGLCDNIELITPETLRHWKRTAIKTARKASGILGINMPAAITVGKPSGTVSQMCGTSSGMHSRWSQHYIRRVRISVHDALFKMMVDQGMPFKMDKGSADTAVFSFPINSPEGCKTRDQDTAINQLDWYRSLVENWCEMNMSCTIYIKEEELLDVCSYVYNHFQSINGVSFFPYSNVKYDQPPYEEIDEATYNDLVAKMPEIDFTKLSDFETKDETEAPRNLSCVGNSCEL